MNKLSTHERPNLKPAYDSDLIYCAPPTNTIINNLHVYSNHIYMLRCSNSFIFCTCIFQSLSKASTCLSLPNFGNALLTHEAYP